VLIVAFEHASSVDLSAVKIAASLSSVSALDVASSSNLAVVSVLARGQ